MTHHKTIAVRSDDPQRTDLERAGWTVAGESWGARLRLAEPGTSQRVAAEARLHDAVAAARARGYDVVELGPDDVAAIAALEASTEPDYPSTPSTAHSAPGAQDLRTLFAHGVRFFGARTGDGELVAVSTIERRADRAETGFTSVRSDHRGRGLAYAVKAAAVLALIAEGFTVFGTGGAAANAGSLAMNRGLGYVVEEHWYDYRAPEPITTRLG
ncbi:acetyltransferase [Xylanimonas allomyrinae]|uniref:Acetyltransferase n=1 Tax=Xylanimonas allomyrinae TaxID=2509459 RepID=A0A4P6EK31_9MICO|nr:acetyltransferase [Xylanimonas allomyrinae]QAY62446.1 acetyltransferase [Xylanimonas allomyrinae]